MPDRAFIIAEAGVNHNGSLDLAHRLVEAAASAGADAVKFQTFRADALVSRTAPKARYQLRTTAEAESQHEMIRRLELDAAAHEQLVSHCAQAGIEFLSTPFDAASLDMLVVRLGISRIKISSGDITNAPFLLQVARTGKPVILSTGMSTLGEVESALGVLAFGFTGESATPSPGRFEAAFASAVGQEALRSRVVLLHCTTEYPAPFAEVNLRAMDTLASAFGLPAGYSDHTRGISVAIAAAARGAAVIEKHFTLDRAMPGPDHAASLQPDELTQLVQSIREVEAALGSPLKHPTDSEMGNRAVARKSLVAARDIRKGEVFSPETLGVKRPGDGLSPFRYWEWLGRPAGRDFASDEGIEP